MKDNCKGCKEFHEHNYWEHTHKNKASFFKFMVGDFDRKMSLPQKFIARCKEKLPELILLKGPGGDKWEVEVVKSENDIFLHFGWSEFVEAHEIVKDSMLTFEYDGFSCFSVKIFGIHECEEEHSFSVKNKHLARQAESESQSETEENSVQILESKEERVVYHCISTSSPIVGSSTDESWPTDQIGEPSLSSWDSRKGKRRRPSSTETKPVKREAAKLRSQSFSAVMKGYNVDGQFQLLVPTDFARKYLPETHEVILRIPNENKEWEVKYRSNSNDSRLLGNWRSFVRDNDLKVGDTCIFQPLKNKKYVMTVEIIRAAI